MSGAWDKLKRWSPAWAAALPNIVVFLAVLPVILAAANGLHLSPAQVAAWIVAIYAVPGVVGLWLATRYCTPVVLTGNLFAILFLATLGDRFPYSQLVGATMLAGAIVALLGALRLTHRLGALVPGPIVYGLLAGAVIPLVSGTFTALGQAPLVVGAALLAYLIGRRLWGTRPTALLLAIAAGLAAAALSGRLGVVPRPWVLPVPVLARPAFSLPALAAITPVLVVLITLQGTVPAVILLRRQGYNPPEDIIQAVSGLGTLLGSVLGPTAVTLALGLTAIVSAPEAGPFERRYRAAYITTGALLVIGALAGAITLLPAVVPGPLLTALAGLSLLAILVQSLQQMARGPLILGPALAMVISLSRISLFGLGPYFWSIVIGAAVSYLLERDAMRQLT